MVTGRGKVIHPQFRCERDAGTFPIARLPGMWLAVWPKLPRTPFLDAEVCQPLQPRLSSARAFLCPVRSANASLHHRTPCSGLALIALPLIEFLESFSSLFLDFARHKAQHSATSPSLLFRPLICLRAISRVGPEQRSDQNGNSSQIGNTPTSWG